MINLTQEIQSFIQSHLNDDPHALILKAHKWPDLPMKDIVEQIQSRKKAKTKLPEWFSNPRTIFPKQSNLEQASSEATAKFKAQLYKGKRLLDLTGGTGVDSYYFSKSFHKVTYVEPNLELAKIAVHNFNALDAGNIDVVISTAEKFIKKSTLEFDLIFIDPSRKPNGGKVFRLEDCEPNILQLLPQLRQISDKILLKASPLLDIDFAIKQLETTDKVWVVSVDNECKELLFMIASGDVDSEIVATNIIKGRTEEFTFKRFEEAAADAEYSNPESYLYEPNASIMKAGAFKSVALSFSLKKLHPNTHLYTSQNHVVGFPGRVFKIEKSELFNWKNWKGKKANISVRNFPYSPEEIKKKAGIMDGGEDYMFFATGEDEKLITILTQKAPGNE
ncbi:MAG: hypothetical protein RJQ09_12170 [Cyclobacteriaceae bacterium]